MQLIKPLIPFATLAPRYLEPDMATVSRHRDVDIRGGRYATHHHTLFIDEQVEAQSRLGIDAWSHSLEVVNDRKLGPSRSHLPNLGADGTAGATAEN